MCSRLRRRMASSCSCKDSGLLARMAPPIQPNGMRLTCAGRYYQTGPGEAGVRLNRWLDASSEQDITGRPVS